MSCFCCPCRFESRKNPHFGVQKGAKYELYINIDGIFRVAHRFGLFVKMPAPGTFLCFASVIFPRRFVVMPCSPCLSTVIPASSVKCIAFSRLAPGSTRAVFFHASSFFAFSRLPASPLGRSLSPALAFFVSRAGRAGLLLHCVGRVPPPLGRSLSPTPACRFFAPLSGGFLRPRLGVLGLPRRRDGFLLRCRAGSAPTWMFVVSRAGRAGLLLHCRAGSVPAWAFFVSRAGRAGFLLRCRAGFFAPAWAFSALRRGRIPIGKQARPRSAGKREVYRKRRKLTNEFPPLLNGIFGHALRFAPAALLPRNIRYGKTACRPTLPVSRG